MIAGTLMESPIIDLEIKVKALLNNSEHHLAYTLNSQIPGHAMRNRDLPLHPLKQAPTDYFHRYLKAVDDACHNSILDLHQIEDMGHHLFRQLLPAELQALLWTCRHGDHTLLIETEETQIPWRLIKLLGRENDAHAEGAFLCEAFQMSQWTTPQQLQTRIYLKPMVLTAGNTNGLPRANDEFKTLTDLLGEVTPVQSGREAVKTLLANGQFRAWHHVGHGKAPTNSTDPIGLVLKTGETLEPAMLDGRAANMGEARPLVVLNCCYGDRSGINLADVGGWGRAVLRTGASAFVGTGWLVGDEAAAQFTQHFYTALAQGVPLAEAMRQTRHALKLLGGADWLTYTLYGHPLAQVVSEEQDIMGRLQTQWQTQSQSAADTTWKTVLTLLAVIKAPVSPALLAKFAGVDPSRVQVILDTWRPWLAVEPGSVEKFKAGELLTGHITAMKDVGEIDVEAAHLLILGVLHQVQRAD